MLHSFFLFLMLFHFFALLPLLITALTSLDLSLFFNEYFDAFARILLCQLELCEFQPPHVLSCHHLLPQLMLTKYLDVPLNQERSHFIIHAVATQLDGLLGWAWPPAFVAVDLLALFQVKLFLDNAEFFVDLAAFIDEEAGVEALAVDEASLDRCQVF